ncbi:SRPBCC family protein [Amaricoccus sp.]|uniref:SRPBCC family protein n=1 Tax=Amaricoccus sp. TaxID=1872485 RepID=UPI001B45A743|nr:SRPBCC family protein [Amaricoccus sp.]MBP7001130.1 SRPBCC family protein [Amaricoccus sp.]
MLKLAAALAAGLWLAAGPVAAHGPSRLKTDQGVTLDATPDEVWAVVGDFADMSWFPGVASVAATGAEKGATRVVTMADGQSVTEELTKLDPARRAISVRVTEDNVAAIPATQYASHIVVGDDAGKARLEWKGAFYRAFPLNDPPPAQNDDAAIAAITALHQTGIDALVARFGIVQ